MSDDRHPAYLDALAALEAGLTSLGARWALLGGAAVVAHGVPRFTADIDATMLGGDHEVAEILEALRGHGIEPRIDDVEGFAASSQVLLLVHAASAVPIDLSLGWLPFEEEAVRSSRIVRFASVEVPLPRPEDLAIYKLIAFRAKDVEDVERLLALHAETMDLDRVAAVLREVCEALEDDRRLEAFEGLVAGVRER